MIRIGLKFFFFHKSRSSSLHAYTAISILIVGAGVIKPRDHDSCIAFRTSKSPEVQGIKLRRRHSNILCHMSIKASVRAIAKADVDNKRAAISSMYIYVGSPPWCIYSFITYWNKIYC